jgi:hypothetical protein
MKKIIFLIFVAFISSCSHSNEVNSDFNKCLKIVDNYDQYRGLMTDTILARFYFATEYLQRISNIKANFVYYDVPHYKSRRECKSDLRKWRKWYDKNMDYLTQERSDSLKREIAKDNIWWCDSTIFQYVFEIE